MIESDDETFKNTDMIHHIAFNVHVDFLPSKVEAMKAMCEKAGWDMSQLVKYCTVAGLSTYVDAFFKDEPKTKAKLVELLGLKD